VLTLWQLLIPHVYLFYLDICRTDLRCRAPGPFEMGNSLQEPFAANEGLLVYPHGTLQFKIVLDL